MLNPQPNTNLLLHGDALQQLKELPDNSVTAIVTDPPYGLSFMGKKWDYDVPSVEFWKEALRVLSPGGTLLCFAGTRTQHRMAVNIEDSGFVLKDCIMWLYGSGFPKALDIGKQVDKIQGNERGVVGDIIYPDGSKSRKTAQTFQAGGNGNILGDTKLTKGNSIWEGWKSHGLKPAYEPIIVAMKPNDGSYANNALAHGVGGLNIEGCRIQTNENLKGGAYCGGKRSEGDWKDNSGFKNNNLEEFKQPQGRFPANIILDEEAGKILDEQTLGNVGNGHWSKTKTMGFGEFGNGKSEYMGVGEKDKEKGGASRFFYCAKASKSERNAGCEELDEKLRSDNNKMMGDPGSFKTGSGNERNGLNRNHHPTVKPLKLMSYLIKLVKQPEKNLILDPFMGSGTTALACIENNVNWIGIEREEEYIKIINARTSHKTNNTEDRNE